MSKNKLAKFAETETFPNFFQPSMEELTKGFDKKGRWHDFFENNNPIVLELGCGRGEYTIGLAKFYPEKNFIGMDIKGARMWQGCRFAIDNQMKNVAFLRTQIDYVNLCFDKGEIEEIWITFPDPQPKKKNKRLTSLRFLERYKQCIANHAKINLKTDSDLLYQYTHMNNTISFNYLPIYYLEPNTRITIDDPNSSIYGDYIIQSISLPLDISSTMTISAYKALQKI